MTKHTLETRFQRPKGWLWGQFTGARGQPLRYGTLRRQKTPLAHVVFVEGLSEYAEKTFELARSFNDMACNFSVFDRHGQGASPRYFPGRQAQHSDGIAKDVDDLITYCRDHIPAGEPIVLLGHSTGALIAMHAMEKEPALFKAGIMVAPLFGIKAVNGHEMLVSNLPLPMGLAEKYAPGMTDWKPRDAFTSILKPEDFSSDPVRNKISDYWPQQDARLRTGGTTFGWVREMCRAIMALRVPSFLGNIKQPVIVFTAGNDKLVSNTAALGLIKNMRNVTHEHYDASCHEMLMEADPIRDGVMDSIKAFLKAHI